MKTTAQNLLRKYAKQNANLYTNLENYLLDCVDTENENKIEFVYKTFISEYANEYNLKYYGSEFNTFVNWLQGLPSCFNVDFEYYKILEIAKQLGIELKNENDEEKFLEYWWEIITIVFFYMKNKTK